MDIPQELVCNLCENLIEKAVVLPCCAGSVCLDCGQSALSRKNACPLGDCLSEGVYSDELIPNRRLRQKASDLREKMKDDEVESGDPVVESTTNDDQRAALFINNASLVESTTHDDEDSNNLLEDYVKTSRDDEVKLDNVSSEVKKASNSSLLKKNSSQEKSNKDVEEVIDSVCKSEAVSVSGKEVKKPPDEKTEKGTSSENVPDQIKTTYGDHSVSIPSEYLNVAKEDPLAAFQKLMEVKDKQKGIIDSTQYYGVPSSSLYPDYINQYPYPLYHNPNLYTPSPYFTGDPYGGVYSVPGSFPNYSAQYRDKKHHYCQRESRKYSSYSEHSSSEKRHFPSRYEKGNDSNYEERKRSQDRSSKVSNEYSQRKHREHRSRKRNRSSSPSKSDRKTKKSKKNDRRSVTRDERKNYHKKENNKKRHSSLHYRDEQEIRCKLQKEPLKKKKNSVSSSSDDSSSSESSSSSSADSSSSEDEDSSSSSSLSSSSSNVVSSKNTKKRKTHRKYQTNKKMSIIKNKKSEESRALDKIIEEHSKNVDTLVDKKKKKSKRRKPSI